MEGRRLVALVFVGLVLVLLVVLWLLPEVDERLRPEPIAAWVGIEVDDSGVARVGRILLSQDQSFRVHAILEARTQGGEPVYYTEAGSIDLGEGQVTEGVRRWDGHAVVKVLWLTLEGAVPFLRMPEGRSLAGFRFEEFLHPEWGRGWTAAGSLSGSNDDQLVEESSRQQQFGTQHYQAWIELFDSDKAIVPSTRFKSPGYDQLEAEPEGFATVVVELEGALAPASRVFGLTQIELPPGAESADQEKLAGLFSRGLAYSRLLVLRSILDSAGTGLDDLTWQRLDLSDGPMWGPPSVQPGDLLRVGSRWVVLFEDSTDAGRSGRLDPEDKIMDFDRGAEILSLSSVFVGGGDIEWAPLTGS